jgi:poly(3-hydroxybutyrate) depolymerase
MSLISVGLLLFTVILDSVCALPQNQALLLRASSGCGKKAFLPGITQYRGLKSSSKDRSYSYHLLSSYDADKSYAVIIGFHGSSSIGAFFELDTKMSQERYSSDKIMVYPNGIDGSWAGPSYHDRSTVAEDIIGDVKGLFCVDESLRRWVMSLLLLQV